MKESKTSIGIYETGCNIDRRLFLKRASVFIVGVLFVRICVRLMLLNLSSVILKLTGSQDISNVLTQLKTADIRPPWLIPLIFAFLISALLVKGKTDKEKSTAKLILFYAAVILTVLILSVMTFLLSLYFTDVNQIRVGQIIKVLYPLIKSGALKDFI